MVNIQVNIWVPLRNILKKMLPKILIVGEGTIQRMVDHQMVDLQRFTRGQKLGIRHEQKWGFKRKHVAGLTFKNGAWTMRNLGLINEYWLEPPGKHEACGISAEVERWTPANRHFHQMSTSIIQKRFKCTTSWQHSQLVTHHLDGPCCFDWRWNLGSINVCSSGLAI